MRTDFVLFSNNIKIGVALGEIKTSKPLTDLSLAIIYSLEQIKERKFLEYPFNVSLDEICEEISRFAPELYTNKEEIDKQIKIDRFTTISLNINED